MLVVVNITPVFFFIIIPPDVVEKFSMNVCGVKSNECRQFCMVEQFRSLSLSYFICVSFKLAVNKVVFTQASAILFSALDCVVYVHNRLIVPVLTICIDQQLL